MTTSHTSHQGCRFQIWKKANFFTEKGQKKAKYLPPLENSPDLPHFKIVLEKSNKTSEKKKKKHSPVNCYIYPACNGCLLTSHPLVKCLSVLVCVCIVYPWICDTSHSIPASFCDVMPEISGIVPDGTAEGQLSRDVGSECLCFRETPQCVHLKSSWVGSTLSRLSWEQCNIVCVTTPWRSADMP